MLKQVIKLKKLPALTQAASTYLKLAMETLEQYRKYAQS